MGGRPVPTSAYGFLYDGIPGEGLYPQVYSDVTDEQMRQWEASKALECMMLDGEKRYFRNAGPNLFRVDSTCYDIKIAKEGTSPSGSEKVNMENLPEIISAVKKEARPLLRRSACASPTR